jgi:Zn-dependent protease with chaperone function
VPTPKLKPWPSCPLWKDGELATRLRNLLAACGYQSTEILVIGGATPTAYCLNHHWIAVSLPLLMQLSVDEVEAIVAHELAHLVLRHHRTRWWLTVSLVGRLWFNRTCKRQEFEADRFAAELVGPMALRRALWKLGEGRMLHIGPRHPSIAQRLHALERFGVAV